MRASILCSVLSGDPPLQIRWYRDGKDILGDNNNISIVSITEFVSSLIINRLDRSFAGNYTCVASSKTAGSVNYTARMFVRGKPLWILKPTSQTAISGTSVRFDCLADGFPQPIIRWKMQRRISDLEASNSIHSHSTSSTTSNPTLVTILSSPRIHVLENGSLIIRAVEVEDQGRYVCEASNGVGKPSSVETSAELLVYEAPVIRPLTAQVVVKRRDRAEVSCQAIGSPPLIFSWMKNDHLLIKDSRGILSTTSGAPGSSSSHFSIHEEDNSPLNLRRERVTVLVLHSVTRNDSGIYSCVANNNYGSDRGNIKVVVQEAPDAPIDLRFLEVSSRSVSLSWVISFNGNSPITGYEVVHKSSNGKILFAFRLPSYISSCSE